MYNKDMDISRRDKKIPGTTPDSFDWKSFDLDSFFEETDSVGEILRKSEDVGKNRHNEVFKNDED